MDVNFEAELSSPFNTRDALCVLWAFLSVSCGCPFPPFSSFLVSIVSLDLIHCCICSFGPGSFFFPYQLFARWRVCESRLIYNGTGSHAGQESSTEYSANVCVLVCVQEKKKGYNFYLGARHVFVLLSQPVILIS